MTDPPEAAHSSETAVTTTEAENPGRVGWRFALGFAGVVALALVVALVSLNAAGAASRAVPTRPQAVVVVDDAKGLLDAWAQAGVHGAALIDVTRDLGYAVPPNAIQHASGLPVPLKDLQGVFLDIAQRPTVVWVATHTGIVRSVTYVLTPQDLAEKVRLGRQNGWPGIAADGRSIIARDEEGFVRFVGAALPTDAPGAAVLNIDASYFVKGTPEQLVAQLQQSGQAYGLVTLNRSIDATDVPDAARARLDAMAALLREQASK